LLADIKSVKPLIIGEERQAVLVGIIAIGALNTLEKPLSIATTAHQPAGAVFLCQIGKIRIAAANRTVPSTPDLQEQADYFEAVCQTFATQPWVAGLFVEDWIPTEETWYRDSPDWLASTSFLNKPAE
jgi:hypothetical protein